MNDWDCESRDILRAFGDILEPEEEECRDSEQPKPSYTSPSTTLLDVALFTQDDFPAVLLQFADAHDGPNHIRDVELDVDTLPVLRDEANFLLPVVLQRVARWLVERETLARHYRVVREVLRAAHGHRAAAVDEDRAPLTWTPLESRRPSCTAN